MSANKLSRTMIIDTAYDFVDEFGLEKLSMRKLADKLHVKAMSLYNHIQNKDDVIDTIVDKVVGEITYDIASEWQETITNRAYAFKETLMKHGWSILPLLSRMNIGEHVLKDFNDSIGYLLQGGFSYGECDQIISSVNSYVYGYVLTMLHFPFEESEYQETAEEYKDFAPKDIYPHLWGLTNEIKDGRYNGVTDFDLGLRFIITGIEDYKSNNESRNK